MTELDDFKKSWKNQNAKLEKSLKMNIEILKKMNLEKINSAFTKFNRAPIMGIIIGMIVNVTLFRFIYYNQNEIGLVWMAVLVLALTLMQTVFSIHQLSIINDISLDDSVLENQRKLARLEKNRNQYLIITRFMYAVLWLPVVFLFFAIFFDINLIQHVNQNWLIINLIIIFAFAVFAFWLSFQFANGRLKHRLLLKIVDSIAKTDYIGQKLRDAIHLLKEIDEFEKEY